MLKTCRYAIVECENPLGSWRLVKRDWEKRKEGDNTMYAVWRTICTYIL